MFSYKVEENLEMRLHSQKYADDLFNAVRKNLEYLRPWMPWATENYSLKDTEDFIKRMRIEFAETDLPTCAIFENNKFVGGIGFTRANFQSKFVEIGYWLDKGHTGKGIITKCCQAFLQYAFEEMEFNRVIIRCASENFKSRAIPEKLGFTNEGTARQEAWLHDKFVDMVTYSMLKTEWDEKKIQM